MPRLISWLVCRNCIVWGGSFVRGVYLLCRRNYVLSIEADCSLHDFRGTTCSCGFRTSCCYLYPNSRILASSFIPNLAIEPKHGKRAWATRRRDSTSPPPLPPSSSPLPPREQKNASKRFCFLRSIAKSTNMAADRSLKRGIYFFRCPLKGAISVVG